MANVLLVIPPAHKVRPNGFAPEIVVDDEGLIGDVWPPGLLHNQKGRINFQGRNPIGMSVTIEGVSQTIDAYGDWDIEITADVDHIETGEALIVATEYVPPLTAWSALPVLTVEKGDPAGSGPKTNWLIAGGTANPSGVEYSALSFNGTSWSAETTTSGLTGTYISFGKAGVGNASDFLQCDHFFNSDTKSTAAYDGTSWTEADNQFVYSNQGVKSAGGTTSAAWTASGEHNSFFRDSLQEFNGTSWSAGTNMNTGMTRGDGSGTQTTIFITGIVDTSFTNDYKIQTYNGTSWTTETDKPSGRCEYNACAGNSGSAIVTSGRVHPTIASTPITHVWDGATWILSTDHPNPTRYPCASGASSASGMGTAGGDDASADGTDYVYEYDSAT